MAQLTLIRGLPGSGKTTRATNTACNDVYCVTVTLAADDFMVDAEGNYRFDPKDLKHAHTACQQATRTLLEQGYFVIVHNTFSQKWEADPYFKIAEQEGCVVDVIDLFDAGLTDEQLAARNTHGVPEETIARMRARWEKF